MSERRATELQRFAFEAHLLARYMPSFKFVSTTPDDTRIEGAIRSPNGSGVYRAELRIGPGYPSNKPSLIITDPTPLLMHDGKTALNTMGASHSYHVLGQYGPGHLRICHTSGWDASRTCVQVITRLALWIRAYEEHRHSGKTIDAIFTQWRQKYD